jgi:ribosomal protein S18 acetylase RimI-like enzyme
MEINILPYNPEYNIHFEKLNKAWLEEYFEVEPIDAYVLSNPQEAILKDGGSILFAELNGAIIGTVALKFIEPGIYELTKMAVDKAFQGIGAGKLLCIAAIEEAKKLGATELILYSQSSLKAAIGIYYKLGFEPIPLDEKYKRADIKMQLIL